MSRGDAKYRDQLQGAWRLLTRSVGSALRLGELMQQPAGAPLKDLLEDPRAAQLKDVQTAREAISILQHVAALADVTLPSEEEMEVVGDGGPSDTGRGPGGAAPHYVYLKPKI